jgi:hypothetical protein
MLVSLYTLTLTKFKFPCVSMFSDFYYTCSRPIDELAKVGTSVKLLFDMSRGQHLTYLNLLQKVTTCSKSGLKSGSNVKVLFYSFIPQLTSVY